MSQSSRVINLILGLILGLLALLVLQSFMTIVSTQTVLLGVIAGLMAVLAVQPISSRAEKRVQYKLVSTASLDQGTLDELGKEGWALVCVDQAKSGYIFRK
jgi:hypothetical protein